MNLTFGDLTLGQLSPLPASHTPWQRWVCSGCIHIALIAVLVLVPMGVQEPAAEPPRVSRVTLNSPPPINHPVQIRMRLPVPKITVSSVVPIAVTVPEPKPAPARKQLTEPVVEKRKVEVTTIEPPRLELTMPAPSASLLVSHMSPAPAIKVGGFGDPNGVNPTNARQTSAMTLAKAGGFDMPAGQGNGSGPGSGKGVTIAGFGQGYGSENGKGPGGQRGTGVRSAGFGSTEGGAQHSGVRAPIAPPTETPVNVIWKPRPVYTEEAREKKIEGDVQLEVVFGANGQVSILRLVRGLGYGLDENARMAASQIRFHPGTRNGSPIDTKATVHIQFELS